VPIIIKECSRLQYNVADSVILYNFLATNPNGLFNHLGRNLLFNSIDIVYEAIAASKYFKSGQYLFGGQEIGKIVTDVLVKDGLDPSWRMHNSNIFTSRDQTPSFDLNLRGTSKDK